MFFLIAWSDIIIFKFNIKRKDIETNSFQSLITSSSTLTLLMKSVISFFLLFNINLSIRSFLFLREMIEELVNNFSDQIIGENAEKEFISIPETNNITEFLYWI